ncbi:MAG TPA: endonuclease III [archaeon]|nr:endonuclease III [archaeon]
MQKLSAKQKMAIKQLMELHAKSSKMRLAAEGWGADWKTLITTMMSAQSRDETTIPIAAQLFEKYSNLQSLSRAKFQDVLEIFKSLNYNRSKARHVIACAKMLAENHGGEVPHDFEKLIALPGVGRKTANVFLSEAGHDAIGIDTHAAYISQKLGWTKNKRSAPHKIEEDLKGLFPKKYWKNVNPVLVRFGKTHTSRKKKDAILEKIKRG